MSDAGDNRAVAADSAARNGDSVNPVPSLAILSQAKAAATPVRAAVTPGYVKSPESSHQLTL